MTVLQNILEADLEYFFSESNDKELFFNEKDFQLHLSQFLRKTGHYSDVDIEYYIPRLELPGYIWTSEVYLDIVVRLDSEFIAIELKYLTKRLRQPISRFGEKFETVEIVKNQGAQNICLYNFWKDVRRIELVKKRFPRVATGYAILLTNDPTYMQERKIGSQCEFMSTHNGLHGPIRHWNGGAYVGKPDFELDNSYTIEWKSCKLDKYNFHYCIIKSI